MTHNREQTPVVPANLGKRALLRDADGYPAKPEPPPDSSIPDEVRQELDQLQVVLGERGIR